MDDLYRVQRWHDTDHGKDRGKPIRANRFRAPRLDPERFVSACWCCCEVCHPRWNPERPNPFWALARAVERRPPAAG